jgi:glucose-6-phosphate isomerase
MLNLDLNNSITKKVLSSYKPKIKKAKLSLLKKKHTEFIKLPYEDPKKLINEILPLKNKFTDVVVVGIGGSILGVQMLHEILYKNSPKTPKFHFIDSIDPNLVASFEKPLKNKKTLFVFISKSGNTLETVTAFSLISPLHKPEQIIVITENKNGLLYQYAKKKNIKIFEMPKYVCGRYSVFTNAGLIPLTLMGVDVKKLLNGAKKVETSGIAEKLSSLTHYLYLKKKKTTLALFPYIDCFEYFNKWTIQLIAESLGKSSKIGPLPISLKGPQDQHSILQLLLDGPKDKWILFFELNKFEKDYILGSLKYSQILKAEKIGTEKALTKKKIQNVTISIDKLDEENLGELIFTFEIAVALSGELLKVNPFNQPAVEIGKKITRSLLNERI